MAIKVRFFASLAEQMGTRQTTVDPVGGETVSSVWQSISGGAAMPEEMLVAVNMNYCDADQSLVDGDEVAYFPPVTGG